MQILRNYRTKGREAGGKSAVDFVLKIFELSERISAKFLHLTEIKEY